MKRLFFILGLALILAGCANERPQRSGVVSVSILPLQYFVDQLTGQSLEVNVMVPAGASHGTYSPSPRQMQRLSDSDLYLRIPSLGYEQAFISRMKEINPGMKVVDLAEDIELIRGIIDHGDHIHEGGVDPHIWMSPRVMMQVLPAMRDALIETYPDLEQVIEQNYLILIEQVESIDKEMEQLSHELNRKSFLIFHPALTYLARDYNLEQISIEHEGKEPSPSQLMRLVNQSRQKSIGVIFIQEEYDQRNAHLVSIETGAAIVQINPLSYEWSKGMYHIMESFRTYLK
jgi:zinc transport system substrate-binding protein